MRSRGFTLLEMLIATLIMAIAVVGLLSNISASLRGAGRVTDYDRAAILAKRKMDELLLNSRLPRLTVLEGQFDAAVAGGLEAGWRAQVTPFEMPPQARPGTPVLDRLELEVWWTSGGKRRTVALEGFRRTVIQPVGAAP